MAVRRAATASSIFPKLTSSIFRPLRSHFSTTPAAADSDDTNSPIIVKGSPQKFKMENPFQKAGPGNVVEVDEVKNCTLVRVAMPGVGSDGFRVWTEENTVFFAGKGEIECESDDGARMYGGSLEFRPELFRADGVKAEMKNGILRLLVPNVDGAKE